MTPLEQTEEDTIKKDKKMFIVLCIISALEFSICFLLFFLFFCRMNKSAVILTDWRFTSAFIMGCAFMNVTTLSLIGDTSQELCALCAWAFFAVATIQKLRDVYGHYTSVTIIIEKIRLNKKEYQENRGYHLILL